MDLVNDFKKNISLFQLLVILLIIAVSLYLFQIFWQVLGIFSDSIAILVLSWILNIILEPLVEKTIKFFHIPRILSAFLIYLLVFGFFAIAIILFIPTVVSQIQSLSHILPGYLVNSPPMVKQFINSTILSFGNALSLIPSVAQFLVNLFVVLIISFYFVIDKAKIQKEIMLLIPRKMHNEIIFIQKTIDDTFGSFLRVQILLGLIIGLLTWIVLVIFGIQFGASTAFISGVFTIIPLLGPFLGIIPPIAITFFTEPNKALLIFVILVALQQVVFNIIAPKLLGKALNLHPVVVLISFFVGFKVAGIIGAIFAIPVLGVLAVILHQLSHHFLNRE